MAEKLDPSGALSQSLIAGSDVTFDYVCHPCSGDGKTLEAVGFCVDCSEFLCADCFKYHRKPTLTRHHKLMDIENIKRKCSQHREETTDYFCMVHDYLGCRFCITMNHKDCKGVQCIPNIVKGTGEDQEISSLIRQLDMVLLQTKVLSGTSLCKRIRSQDIFDKALYHIKHTRKTSNEALKKLEEEIEKEADKMKIIDVPNMDAIAKSCDRKLGMKALTRK